MPPSRTGRGTNSSDARTQTGRPIAVATSRRGGKRPRNTDSAGTAKNLPPRIRPGARPVPKNTGSRDARATPSGKLWKRKNQPRSRPKSQETETPGRANPSGGRSQEAGTPSLRPEEGTDTGAQGTTTPRRPGKADRGQVHRALRDLLGSHHPRRDQVRDVRRTTPAIPQAGHGKSRPAEGPALRTGIVLLTLPQARFREPSQPKDRT